MALCIYIWELRSNNAEVVKNAVAAKGLRRARCVCKREQIRID